MECRGVRIEWKSGRQQNHTEYCCSPTQSSRNRPNAPILGTVLPIQVWELDLLYNWKNFLKIIQSVDFARKRNTCKQCLIENPKMWYLLFAFKFCMNCDLVEWIVSQIFITETLKPEVSRLWGTFKISVGMAKLTNYVFMSLQSTCFVNIQCFVVLRKEASWGGQTNNQNNKSDYLQVWRAAASHNNHENNPNISPLLPVCVTEPLWLHFFF